MKNKPARKVPQFYYHFFKPFGVLLAFFKYHYHLKNKYKIGKNESVVVLSNHQTDLDPVLVNLAFNRVLNALATDNIFKKGIVDRFLTMLGAIAKHKGSNDLRSAMDMKRVINQGGSLLIFPEGNRSYAEFQYYITPQIGKSLKLYKSTIVLFNLHGGFGKSPRFAHKTRKGRLYGEIKKVLRYEYYKDMSDEELTKTIIENLKVYDVESGELFKSKKRAEYLERMFFVCPKCGKVSTLYSKGNYIKCNNCGLNVEYTENLRLKSDDESFKFTRLLDWYNYQKDFVKNLVVEKDKFIFTDKKVKMFSANPHQKHKRLCKGDMSLSDTKLTMGKFIFDVKNIEIASPVSGRKLLFTYQGESYQIKGSPRFNALKYVLLFNKLDTMMRNEKVDNYFTLEREKM